MTLHAQVRRFRGPESLWNAHLNDEQLNYQAPEDDQADESVATRQANRSRDNIATWNAYLPEDCVKTMVNMGWDRNT